MAQAPTPVPPTAPIDFVLPKWNDPQSVASYIMMAAGIVCTILHVTNPSWMSAFAQAAGLAVAAGAALYQLWRRHNAKSVALQTGMARLVRKH